MQKGFFTPEELEENIQVEFDFDEGPHCQKCGLSLSCRSPKMKYTGQGKKGVLIISEAPGSQEDEAWEQLGYEEPTQLIGEAGQLLRRELKILKLDLDTDFWKTNALSCRPHTASGANRPPTKTELKNCKPLVDKTIKELNPKMIWLLGGKAVESFYMGRFSNLSINRWRKLCIPDRKTGAWIIPLFHPSYILRQQYDENLKATFKRDLKWAASCINKKPFTLTDEREDVIRIYDFDLIVKVLTEILRVADDQSVMLYKDYETNCLKPQWPGSKIATVSLCFNKNVVKKIINELKEYKFKTCKFIGAAESPEFLFTNTNSVSVAFPFQYSDFFSREQINKLRSLLRKIHTSQNIAFQAHNIKFEDSWDREILGVQAYSWNWDTMLAAHILDNRSKFTGLKFQSYINFGLEPYNKEIDKYLKAKSGHFNKVDKAPLDELLLYNGIDTKTGTNLYQKQQEQFALTNRLYPKNRLAEAYSLFHSGTLAFSDIQRNGICIDEEYYKKEEQGLIKKIEGLKNKLTTSKEAVQFKEATNKELDFASPKDLGNLFYDILKLPVQLTGKDNYRVDEDALESIKLPFVKDLLQLRKLEKANNTYIAQLLREVCQGKVYPFIDLNIPISGRSSSSLPNWQNIPIRDPEVGKLIRSGIFPSKGNKIVELDYQSMEVRMAAVVTGDPNLKKYVLNPLSDMHLDSAQDIWILPPEEVTKDIRKNIKGDFVFAELYGSFYKNCAISLWKHSNYKITSGITLKQHIKSKGISNLAEFTEHCKEAERILWQERFPVYAQWKKDTNELYRRQGFIDNNYGFRFVGYLSEKQVNNFPIQSVSFHTLLHGIVLITEIAKKEKWRSKLMGEIHDSLLVDLHPTEEDHVIKTCVYILSEKMRELHPWIDVPIPTSVEITPTNKPWATKKEIEI